MAALFFDLKYYIDTIVKQTLLSFGCLDYFLVEVLM